MPHFPSSLGLTLCHASSVRRATDKRAADEFCLRQVVRDLVCDGAAESGSCEPAKVLRNIGRETGGKSRPLPRSWYFACDERVAILRSFQKPSCLCTSCVAASASVARVEDEQLLYNFRAGAGMAAYKSGRAETAVAQLARNLKGRLIIAGEAQRKRVCHRAPKGCNCRGSQVRRPLQNSVEYGFLSTLVS